MKRIGTAMVLLGALLLVVSAGAFATIEGNRDVAVQTAPDDSALIALEPTGNTVDSRGTATLIGQVRNNFDRSVAISFTANSGYSGITLDPQSGDTTLLSGEAFDIEATCDPPDGGTGNTEITVSFGASAENTDIADGTLTATVAYDCPGRPGDDDEGEDDEREDDEREDDE